jgi:hypothetical protein
MYSSPYKAVILQGSLVNTIAVVQVSQAKPVAIAASRPEKS